MAITNCVLLFYARPTLASTQASSRPSTRRRPCRQLNLVTMTAAFNPNHCINPGRSPQHSREQEPASLRSESNESQQQGENNYALSRDVGQNGEKFEAGPRSSYHHGKHDFFASDSSDNLIRKSQQSRSSSITPTDDGTTNTMAQEEMLQVTNAVVDSCYRLDRVA
ncbi:uncharacterized protein PAC_05904 [Phialocephala subalpina]|uniref:Uncharacterized protein n=1 Tax=Phialocephala subalpina TaxID=576137 RepID=A0A1L7WTE0_9HELO|nr:uncharacterized protein PAC_05904 [Phialocephala subalpina]